MEQLHPQIWAKMLGEDSWLESHRGILFLLDTQRFGEIPKGLETTIKILELDRVEYEQSAALHCFLGSQYQTLSEELSYDFKLEIEKEKLRLAGKKESIIDYEGKSVDEILASLPNEGKYFREKMQVGADMVTSWQINNYLRFDKTQRAKMHLDKALTLSCDKPTTVFEYLIKPVIISRMENQEIPKDYRVNEMGDCA